MLHLVEILNYAYSLSVWEMKTERKINIRCVSLERELYAAYRRYVGIFMCV